MFNLRRIIGLAIACLIAALTPLAVQTTVGVQAADASSCLSAPFGNYFSGYLVDDTPTDGPTYEGTKAFINNGVFSPEWLV